MTLRATADPENTVPEITDENNSFEIHLPCWQHWSSPMTLASANTSVTAAAAALMALASVCLAEERIVDSKSYKRSAAYRAWQRQVVKNGFPGTAFHSEVIREDYATEQRGKAWNFEDGTMCGITYLAPEMKDVRVANGMLCFIMGADEVMFGWGQLEPERHKTYVAPLEMQSQGRHMMWSATVKVSRGPASVGGRFYRFGKDGGGWKEDIRDRDVGKTALVRSYWPRNSVRADSYQGFALEVKAPVGTEVEIDDVSAARETVRTFCRRSFELPAGDPVYSTTLNVALNNALYVNGVQLHDQEYMHADKEYCVVPVDLAAALRPGKNVVCLYSELVENGPCTYAAGKVILASGSEIDLGTDEHYRVTAHAYPGWTAVDFDDSAWNTPRLRRPNGLFYGHPYPALYFGPIVIENPRGGKLMYDAREDVEVRVRLPKGHRARNPVVFRTLQHADSAVERLAVPLPPPSEDDTSLVYTFRAGRLSRGIYHLRVSVTLDGDQRLSRSTPIMVAGPVAQKEVEGHDFEDGIKMTLVDEVRCYDPDDPHPYMDSEGSRKGNRIVEKDGLKYRESGARRHRDFFAYKLTFTEDQLFQPHAIDITYPDNEQRSVQIAFLDLSRPTGGLVGTTSFEKFPLSGGYRHSKLFWFPRLEHTYVFVTCNMAGHRAAVHSIKIYRVDDVPALKTYPSGERFIGQMHERNTCHGEHFDPGPCFATLYGATGNCPDFHRRWFHANEWLVKMMRFGGENLLANGVYQYSRHNLGYAPVWRAERAELDFNYMSMLAKQFEYEGIALLPCLEFMAPTAFPKSGRAVHGVARQTQNLASPDGYRRLLQIAADLADQFARYESFKGLQYICFPSHRGAAFMPAVATGAIPFRADEPYEPLLTGYDDVLIRAFSQEENVKIPVAYDDPERRVKRYKWIKANALAKWISWRCGKIHEFNRAVVAELHRRRRDLCVYPTIDFDVFLSKPVAKKRLDPARYLLSAGYDPRLARGDRSISWPRFYNQMFHHNRSYGITDWPLAESFNTDPALTAFWDRDHNRSAYILTHFDENFTKVEPDWFPPEFEDVKKHVVPVWPAGKLGIFQTFMPPGEHCLAAFRDVIRDTDANVLIYGWSDKSMPFSHLYFLRRISRAFVALPGGRFTTLKGNGLDRNIVVKELRKDGDYYFYVLNDTCWHVDATLTLEVAARVIDIGVRKDVPAPEGRLSLKLLPYETRSFKIAGRGGVKAGAAVPEPAGKEHAQATVRGLKEKLRQNPQAQLIYRGPALNSFQEHLGLAEKAAASEDIGQAAKHLSSGVVEAFASYRLRPDSQASSWYVIGCFPGDRFERGVRNAYPVERDVLAAGTVDLGRTYKGSAGGYERAAWRKVITETWQGVTDCVVLHDLYGQPDWQEAYAFSQVYAPEDRACTLQVRSDDGIRIWINGKLVHDHPIARGITWHPDRVQVTLRKSWNKVLVKLENVWSGWGFQFVFLRPDGTPHTDMVVACDGGST